MLEGLSTRSMLVTENEQEASSISIRTSWYELTLMDAQDQVPRSMIGRNKSSDQTLQQEVGKSSISEGETAAVELNVPGIECAVA